MYEMEACGRWWQFYFKPELLFNTEILPTERWKAQVGVSSTAPVALARTVPTFQELLQAVPHHVDIFYADEFEANVIIVIFVLIALPSSSVGHGI